MANNMMPSWHKDSNLYQKRDTLDEAAA